MYLTTNCYVYYCYFTIIVTIKTSNSGKGKNDIEPVDKIYNKRVDEKVGKGSEIYFSWKNLIWKKLLAHINIYTHTIYIYNIYIYDMLCKYIERKLKWNKSATDGKPQEPK